MTDFRTQRLRKGDLVRLAGPMIVESPTLGIVLEQSGARVAIRWLHCGGSRGQLPPQELWQHDIVKVERKQ